MEVSKCNKMSYFLDLNTINATNIAALDDQDNQITFGELVLFCKKFKTIIKPRSLVFHFSENSVASLKFYIACIESKAIPLLLSTQTDSELIKQLIDKYQPNYLVVPDQLVNLFEGQVLLKNLDYNLIKISDQVHEIYHDLALLLPTSGSTGSPKLVRHSYQNVESSASNVKQFFNIHSTDRAFAFLPMFYTMGLSVIHSYLKAGASVLLVKASMTDAKFWSLLKSGGATSLTGVPYSFEILKKMRFFRMKLPQLRLITQGGGKLSEELYEDCVNYASEHQIAFIPTYGQTEGTARMAFLDAQYSAIKRGSIGKAIPNGVISIIDNKGKETFEGEASGEMIYRGENVTLGYASGKEDLNLGDERKGLLYTGDLVRRDVDGFHYIIGRKSRFLKLYGIRVALDEIENLISKAFNLECVCGGNDSKMIVLVTKPKNENAITEFITQKTGLFHQSFEIKYVAKIPRNETGKVIFNDKI
jgi:long-chain acyl-CoA synthetase